MNARHPAAAAARRFAARAAQMAMTTIAMANSEAAPAATPPIWGVVNSGAGADGHDEPLPAGGCPVAGHTQEVAPRMSGGAQAQEATPMDSGGDAAPAGQRAQADASAGVKKSAGHTGQKVEP